MIFKTLLSLFISISAQSMTCPDLSGHYMDEENTRLQIIQNMCAEITFVTYTTDRTIKLDGRLRLSETGQKHISYVSGTIQKDQLTLEQIIKDKNNAGPNYIYRTVLTYKYKDAETLIEDTKLYNQSGKLIDYKTMTLLRVK